jgi:hypothetical protein
MLSFPHFYLADPKFREAVEGISPPDPEKHRLYIDVQPVSYKTAASVAVLYFEINWNVQSRLSINFF